MSAVLPTPAAAATHPEPAGPWQRAWRRLRRRHAALLGLAIVIAFIVLARVRAVDRAHDPIATSWGAIRKAPSARALVRHRRDRPRRAVARDLGHARVAAGRDRVGVDLAADRRADRAGGGFPRRLGGRDRSRASPTPSWPARS
jgi:hypothetical protein